MFCSLSFSKVDHRIRVSKFINYQLFFRIIGFLQNQLIFLDSLIYVFILDFAVNYSKRY